MLSELPFSSVIDCLSSVKNYDFVLYSSQFNNRLDRLFHITHYIIIVIWEVETKILGSTRCITMIFLTKWQVLYGGMKSEIVFTITHLVFKLQTRFWTSFAGLSILTWEMDPEYFRLIFKRLAVWQNSSLKCRFTKYRELYGIQSLDFRWLAGWHYVILSRYWPSFESFWLVELKMQLTILYTLQRRIIKNLACVVLILAQEFCHRDVFTYHILFTVKVCALILYNISETLGLLKEIP